MNKKSILIFLLGVFSSGVVFGLVFVMKADHPVSASLPSPMANRPMQMQVEELKVTPPNVIPEPPKAEAGEMTRPVLQAMDTPAFKALVSSAPDPHSQFYEVKPHDNLTSIAKKHDTTVDLLKRINNLANDKLSPGQKLKVPVSKFSVVVDKSQNILILKADEEVLKTYVVATGRNNSTPVGSFKIKDKIVNPTWYKQGAVVPYGSPANELGTRWLGITKRGYGIHGTIRPESLGQQVTAGCVRMKNEDVEELFGFAVPGTEVTIVD